MTNIWLKVGGWVGRLVLALALVATGPAAQAQPGLVSQCERTLTSLLRGVGVLPDPVAVEAHGIFARLDRLWAEEFAKAGLSFTPPQLVIFRDSVETAGCGHVSADRAPFYCPPDRKIYIDLSFWHVLEKWGAPDIGARWYVLAHEYGHHVTQLTGFLPEVLKLESSTFPAGKNAVLAMSELTADALAGYFLARMVQAGVLGPESIAQAMRATHVVGDDAVQVRSRGRVYDRSCFRHGTSQQRSEWFQKGFLARDPWTLNAFQDPSLKQRFPEYSEEIYSLVMLGPSPSLGRGRAAH